MTETPDQTLSDSALSDILRAKGAARKIIDGQALRHALTALARAHQGDDTGLRVAALALLKSVLTQSHAVARDGLVQGRYRGGRCAEVLCAAQDEIITALCDFTRIHVLRLANPTAEEQVTVVAVGGYGRGRLAPNSDIDLLFLLPYKRNSACESFVEYVLYMLWDMGLKVGHATRRISDCLARAEADMTIRTTLLEARFLWGDNTHFDAFWQAFAGFIAQSTTQDFVAAKLEERDARHERSGKSRYLVEPDLKDGKGGLRDLNSLFWIAKYCYGVSRLDELVAYGVFRKSEMARFRACENFLWAVRCHLHFIRGRGDEVLSFDIQPELTRLMRGIGAGQDVPQKQVERFMRQYFLAAKHVGDLTAIFCAALEAEQKKPRRRVPNPFRPRKQIKSKQIKSKQIEGFRVAAGRLQAVRRDIFTRNPLNLVRIFHLADKYGLDIHPETTRHITRATHLVNAKLRANETANRLFLEILTSKRDPERSLRRMSEAGVLGRFITDFGRIIAMMQFNMYHHYTADEHLLRAIGICAEIERDAESANLPLVARLFARKALNRRVLYLTVLLHDIAKGRPQDHSLAGAKIARRLAPRLGFTPEETALTAWLVEEHLFMSDVAQKRDLSDPQTVEDFVAKVQTMERLVHLYVLTIVDISAVGPGVWTAWKAQLMDDLYLEAVTRLTGEGAAEDSKRRRTNAQAALRHLLPDWRDDAFAKYVARFQAGYWLGFEPAILAHHAHLLAQMRGKTKRVIDIAYDTARGVDVLTFIGADHPGVFARLTGACAVMGVDILDARVTTTKDGLALDHFDLRDRHETTGRARVLEGKRKARFVETIDAVLAGELLPAAQMEAKKTPRYRRKLEAFSITPNVRVDNGLSEQASVIEVSGLDRPGLLYATARVLLAADVSLVSARVATFGERANDVFYVQDMTGQKITSAQRRKSIETRLLKVVADPKRSFAPHQSGS